ncbi:hypothetical protein BJY00DRAFT_312720 [Aspergillus carlsbadensis]|nr:hypothetical protein BJY00DRAFT_312720 [Aspergillus carlsbadensis]
MNPPLHLPFTPREVVYASSTMTTTDSDTRIRKRRSHGSSSDRAPIPTEDGIIEVDYRAGGRSSASPRHKYYNLVANEAHRVERPIVHLFNDENIRGLVGVYLVGRQSVYALQDEPVPTLLISMDRIESGEHERDRERQGKERRNWTDLVRISRASLRKSLVSLWQSDLQNNLDLDGESIHPCYPTDAIFPVWTDVAEEILTRISDPTGIFTIGCFRVGGKIYTRDRYWGWTVEESRERCPPTVVIGVDRLVMRDWIQVRETVIAILDARGLDEVAVLIRKDADSRPVKAVGDWDPQSPLEVWNCRPNPDLGSSLNNSRAAGDAAFGTLGAWVEVQDLATGDWVPMALTSATCCLPPEEGLSAEDMEVLSKWKRDGSPSRNDVEKGIECHTSEINRAGLNPSETSAQRIAERRKDRETMQEYLDNHGHLLGHVFAASGLRVAPSPEDASKLSIRDWALVRPNADHSVGKNNIGIVKTLPGRELHSFSLILPRPDQPMTDGRTQPIVTWEHAMVRNGHIGRLGDQRDSGALVLDHVDRALGMVFGGSMAGDLAYFTSARELVEDIKRSSTGIKAVRVPGDEFWEYE